MQILQNAITEALEDNLKKQALLIASLLSSSELRITVGQVEIRISSTSPVDFASTVEQMLRE